MALGCSDDKKAPIPGDKKSTSPNPSSGSGSGTGTTTKSSGGTTSPTDPVEAGKKELEEVLKTPEVSVAKRSAPSETEEMDPMETDYDGEEGETCFTEEEGETCFADGSETESPVAEGSDTQAPAIPETPKFPVDLQVADLVGLLQDEAKAKRPTQEIVDYVRKMADAYPEKVHLALCYFGNANVSQEFYGDNLEENFEALNRCKESLDEERTAIIDRLKNELPQDTQDNLQALDNLQEELNTMILEAAKKQEEADELMKVAQESPLQRNIDALESALIPLNVALANVGWKKAEIAEFVRTSNNQIDDVSDQLGKRAAEIIVEIEKLDAQIQRLHERMIERLQKFEQNHQDLQAKLDQAEVSESFAEDMEDFQSSTTLMRRLRAEYPDLNTRYQIALYRTHKLEIALADFFRAQAALKKTLESHKEASSGNGWTKFWNRRKASEIGKSVAAQRNQVDKASEEVTIAKSAADAARTSYEELLREIQIAEGIITEEEISETEDSETEDSPSEDTETEEASTDGTETIPSEAIAPETTNSISSVTNSTESVTNSTDEIESTEAGSETNEVESAEAASETNEVESVETDSETNDVESVETNSGFLFFFNVMNDTNPVEDSTNTVPSVEFPTETNAPDVTIEGPAEASTNTTEDSSSETNTSESLSMEYSEEPSEETKTNEVSETEGPSLGINLPNITDTIKED